MKFKLKIACAFLYSIVSCNVMVGLYAVLVNVFAQAFDRK